MPRKHVSVGSEGLGAFRAGRDEHNRFVVATECAECDFTKMIRFKASNVPIDAIARKFTQAGWSVSKNYTLTVCPNCQPGKTVKAANTDTPKPSAPSLKAQRQLHRLLEEHFEPDLFRYVGDWNDAKVAQEVGLSVAYVAEVREEAYGPTVDPQVDELRRLLEDTERQLKSDLESLEVMLKQAAKTAKERVADVHRRLSLLEAR